MRLFNWFKRKKQPTTDNFPAKGYSLPDTRRKILVGPTTDPVYQKDFGERGIPLAQPAQVEKDDDGNFILSAVLGAEAGFATGALVGGNLTGALLGSLLSEEESAPTAKSDSFEGFQGGTGGGAGAGGDFTPDTQTIDNTPEDQQQDTPDDNDNNNDDNSSSSDDNSSSGGDD